MKVDPITFAVIKSGLDSIADDMAYTVVRIARSEIVKDVMDFSAASSLSNSTKAKPRGRPVSRSATMLTRSTFPYASNSERTAASVAAKSKFPTKIFFT